MKTFRVTVTYYVQAESEDSSSIMKDVRKFNLGDGEPTETVEYLHHDIEEVKES